MQSIFQDIGLLATLAAIIVGPVFAVLLTRWLDDRRERKRGRRAILSDLMRTRRARLDPTHVSALNLVELEFFGDQNVISAFQLYAKHLNSVWPIDGGELERQVAEGDDLFADLLTSIAKSLGYTFDKRDLERRGYLPKGLGQQNDNQIANAHFLREVFEGRRPIHIANFNQNDGIFPPNPTKQIEQP